MSDPPPSLAWLRPFPQLLRWLELEQTVNDWLAHPRVFASIAEEESGVRPALRAKARASWRLAICWVPEEEARVWGDARGGLAAALGLAPRSGRVPVYVHPQGAGLFRDAIARHGLETSDIHVTPTSSERSLVAWRDGATSACVLKVSLGVVIGGRRRVVRERDVARALVMSRVLDDVPAGPRAALGLETFPEIAGAVVGGRGYLVRGLPPVLRAVASPSTLVPLFSFVSQRGAARSMIEEAALAAGGDPLDFALDAVVEPYVQALAYLLFDRGIVVEPHAQNVALAVGRDGVLERRVVLRDLSDASVHLGVRIARGRGLPSVADLTPKGAPVSALDEAVRPLASQAKRLAHRASIAVVRYGMYGVVWSLHRALARSFPSMSRERLYRSYLGLWQSACAHYLGVVPARHGAHTLDLDDALHAYMRSVDWCALGAGRPRAMSAKARPLPAPRAQPRRARGGGVRYREIDCAWGTLGIEESGAPAYFVPLDA